VAVTVFARLPVREQSARRFLAIAATLGVLGIAFNLNNEDQLMPKVLAVAGVVALVWSIHRFGRLGPDDIIVFDEPPAPPLAKKKKKKRAVEAAPQAPSKPTPDGSDPH
jgi:hypothetical protein